ncbi:hypothetical protein ACW2Q0_00015 [Nocardia sp. R16R-3T]
MTPRTGRALLTCTDQLTTLATVLGHPLDMVDVPEDVAREHTISSGMSLEFADGALVDQTYIRTGGNAVRTVAVRQVLGRASHSYAEWGAPCLRLHHPHSPERPRSPRRMSDFHLRVVTD